MERTVLNKTKQNKKVKVNMAWSIRSSFLSKAMVYISHCFFVVFFSSSQSFRLLNRLLAYAPRHFGQLQFFSSNMTFVFITYTFLYLISNSVYNICQITFKMLFKCLYSLSYMRSVPLFYSCLSFCSLGSFQLSPGHFWSRSEPENPPAWHPRIPRGRLWNAC